MKSHKRKKAWHLYTPEGFTGIVMGPNMRKILTKLTLIAAKLHAQQEDDHCDVKDRSMSKFIELVILPAMTPPNGFDEEDWWTGIFTADESEDHWIAGYHEITLFHEDQKKGGINLWINMDDPHLSVTWHMEPFV